MNEFEYTLKIFGNTKLKVQAEDKRQADIMVKDLIDKIKNKKIKLYENEKENINIVKSNINFKIKNAHQIAR